MRNLVYATILFSTMASATDYRYLEFGVGKNTGTNDWVGDYPAHIELGYHKEFSDNVYGNIHYRHESNLEKGPPFNNEHETWVESFGISIGVKF